MPHIYPSAEEIERLKTGWITAIQKDDADFVMEAGNKMDWYFPGSVKSIAHSVILARAEKSLRAMISGGFPVDRTWIYDIDHSSYQNKRTLLQDAASYRWHAGIEMLLAAGASPTLGDPASDLPLLAAIKGCNDGELIDFLALFDKYRAVREEDIAYLLKNKMTYLSLEKYDVFETYLENRALLKQAETLLSEYPINLPKKKQRRL